MEKVSDQVITDAASRVAELVKKGIKEGTLLTNEDYGNSLNKLIELHLAGTPVAGVKALVDAITLSVKQAIPVGSIFDGRRAEQYNPELGIKGMTAERLREVKAELFAAMLPGANMDLMADAMGVQLSFLEGARSRVIEAAKHKKTLTTSNGPSAGFAIPDEFIAEVQRKLVYASALRASFQNWSGVGLKGSMPKETGTVTVSYQVENPAADPSPTDLALGLTSWGLNKRFSFFAMTNELIRFSPIDLMTLMSTMFAEQNRVKDDSVFMTGSGSGVPTGLRTIKTGMNSVAQAGTDIQYSDLVRLKHSLPVQYRLDGAFLMMNNATLSLVAQMLDGQGRPLFLDKGMAGIGGPNIPAQTIGFILGLPVMEVNSLLSNYGAGANTSEIWLCNKRGYSIFDNGGMEFATSNEAGNAFARDLWYARGINYDDGKVNIAEANSYLSGVK